ncbi:hypothetical protein SHIRM173S_08782 [Streptomyces hirsutus]
MGADLKAACEAGGCSREDVLKAHRAQKNADTGLGTAQNFSDVDRPASVETYVLKPDAKAVGRVVNAEDAHTAPGVEETLSGRYAPHRPARPGGPRGGDRRGISVRSGRSRTGRGRCEGGGTAASAGRNRERSEAGRYTYGRSSGSPGSTPCRTGVLAHQGRTVAAVQGRPLSQGGSSPASVSSC